MGTCVQEASPAWDDPTQTNISSCSLAGQNKKGKKASYNERPWHHVWLMQLNSLSAQFSQLDSYSDELIPFDIPSVPPLLSLSLK